MTPQTRRPHPRRAATVAALTAVLALAAAAPPAGAALSSASFDGTTATLNLDGADDHVTVSVSAGLLMHSDVGGGLDSNFDWDSGPKEQTVPADGTVHVVVNGGDGNDTLTVLAGKGAIADATLNGDAGDDFLTGAETDDSLNGGDGNDTLVGRQGTDLMHGGAGDDTFVWNNGDGSDRQTGDEGVDTTEVNGSADLGDTFTLVPVLGGVRFQRTNLVPFRIDSAAERIQVNGLGGDDSVTAADGVGAQALLSVDGGDGADTISGSDGPDVLTGGSGRDTIDGGAGDDQIDVRDNSADVAIGGDGNDTAVADAADLDVLDGFEVVDRPPVATPPPVVVPPPTVAPPPTVTPPAAVTPPALFLAPPNVAAPRPVTIRTTKATVSHGRASIKVTCPATSPGTCTGSLTLLTALRPVELGSTRYSVARGATATLKLKLRRTARRFADRNGHLKVVARARTSVSGAAAQSSHLLTLALRASTNPTH